MLPSEEVMRSCDCPFCAAYRSRLLGGRKGGALPAGDLGVPATKMHHYCQGFSRAMRLRAAVGCFAGQLLYA